VVAHGLQDLRDGSFFGRAHPCTASYAILT
jgi:hypothetical protein